MYIKKDTNVINMEFQKILTAKIIWLRNPQIVKSFWIRHLTYRLKGKN